MLTIERKMTMQASVDVVWELLSTEEGMRQWFESDMDIDVRIGGKHRHVDKETGQLVTGEVFEIDPMKKISLSWFEDGPDTDWVNPIRFTFYLEEVDEGTLVTFVKDGFEQIGKATWHLTFEAYERGAERHSLLENLKKVAEAEHVHRQ